MSREILLYGCLQVGILRFFVNELSRLNLGNVGMNLFLFFLMRKDNQLFCFGLGTHFQQHPHPNISETRIDLL